MPKEHDDEDSSIVDALSALGWVEEKEDDEEAQAPSMDYLKQQLETYKQQNRELFEEYTKASDERDKLKRENETLSIEFEEFKKTASDTQLEGSSDAEKDALLEEKDGFIRDLKFKLQDLGQKMEEKKKYIQELYANKSKNEEKAREQQMLIDALESKIKELSPELEEKQQIIEQQAKNVEQLTTQIQELNKQVEQLEKNQTENSTVVEKLQEKDAKIKELTEQLTYLENDTVQKSKFDKLQVLLEKKDEIITEKEKSIFEVENSLTSASQKINELQNQVETFSLVKKDLEKKEDRIKELVIENEQLKQKTTEVQEKGVLLQEKGEELNKLKDKVNELKKKLEESEKIEDKILNDLQAEKDKSLKFESEMEHKNLEIIELKKKMKLLRRDMLKSQ